MLSLSAFDIESVLPEQPLCQSTLDNGDHSEVAVSCTSTSAPSLDSWRSEQSSSSSSGVQPGYLDQTLFMPLGSKLGDQLIGPLGVSENGWILPPWCEGSKERLHHNVRDMACAWNSKDQSNQDAFVPLCYTGSFGKVQFFWPAMDNS